MPASWVLLPQQPAGFDIENPDPGYGAAAARIDLAHVDDLFVVRRTVNDPAAGGCEGSDTIARPGLWLRLLTRRRPGNPDAALACLRQVTCWDAERCGGAGRPSNVARRGGVQDDGSRGVGAGTGNQETGEHGYGCAAAQVPPSEMVGP